MRNKTGESQSGRRGLLCAQLDLCRDLWIHLSSGKTRVFHNHHVSPRCYQRAQQSGSAKHSSHREHGALSKHCCHSFQLLSVGLWNMAKDIGAALGNWNQMSTMTQLLKNTYTHTIYIHTCVYVFS